LFNVERVVPTTPKALAEVLVTKNYDFVKPGQVARGIGRILGVGVLLAEGDEHKIQRKNLMPAFAFRHIKDLYPTFWTKSREAVLAMTARVKGIEVKEEICTAPENGTEPQGPAVIEVGDWASRATLDIIGVAGLGQDFGAIRDPTTPLNKTYRALFKPTRQAQILGLLNLFLPGWFLRNIPIKRNGDIEEAARVIRATCRQLIRAKKEKLEKNELTDVDILSVAMESGGFTEENLIDQLMTFLAAGHETTASAMTWAVYMLCLNPDVQTRLRAEIREKLPSVDDNDANITSQTIDHMPYLNAVCNEVLRYYSPVPLTLREAACDTSIADQFIPKGTRIMLVPWAINKSESLWGPDALKFNPDRWLPTEKNPHSANGGAPSNYAMLTFLHGPRSCIGQAFAKAEFACLLACWIGRFEFTLNDEKEFDEKNMLIKGGVTVRPAKGLYVKTKVVEGW
jgi:cytochrome P450